MARAKKSVAVAADPPVTATQSKLFGDLRPVDAPSGYPTHGEWVTWDDKKPPSATTHSCGGLLMLPEQAGVMSPSKAPEENKNPVACARCTARDGRLVLVGDRLHARVVAASHASGVRVGQLGATGLVLGHLSKPARVVLRDAFDGQRAKVKDSHNKPFLELIDHGLVTHGHTITDAGLRVAKAAGWT